MTTAAPQRVAAETLPSNAFYVRGITLEARDVLAFDLRPAGGTVVDFEPGAHIELELPNAIVRHYSLINRPGERDRYVICVKRDVRSRGGSSFLHDHMRAGATVNVKSVRNNFRLATDPAPVLLIAGGIGVTPIVAMAEQLAADGHPADIVYAVKSRDELAFYDRLAHAASRLTVHIDEEAGSVLDLDAIVASTSGETHLYCCGPAPMLDAFLTATEQRSPHYVHFERFAAVAPSVRTGGAFTVELARSGCSVAVAENETILGALRAAGITAASSCEEGICGTCEVRVLDGTPDHRDGILSASERQANRSMMICCSRSIGDRLVLDV